MLRCVSGLLQAWVVGSIFIGASPGQASYRVLSRVQGIEGLSEGGTHVAVHVEAFQDINGDGALDIFGVLGDVVLALGDGRGGFRPWVAMPAPRPRGWIGPDFGDVDGDGDCDVYCGILDFANRDASDEVYINDGFGGFSVEGVGRVPQAGRDANVCELIDVDGDGDLDVALGGYLSWWVPGGRARNWIYLNDGSGRFYEDATRASLPAISDDTQAIESDDIDGDGDVDLVFGNFAVGPLQNQSRVNINDGSGHFASSQAFPANRAWVPRLFDMDGDGDLDIGFFARGLTVSLAPVLYENDGTGWFTDVSAGLPIGDFAGADFGDVDGDGDIDIVCVAYPVDVGGGEVLSVFQWVNDGGGRFTDQSMDTMPVFSERTTWGAYQLSLARLADLDMDGDLDIVLNPNVSMAPPSGYNPILWNMTRYVYPPAPARIGQSYTVDFYARPGNVVLPAAAFAPARVELPGIGVLGLDPASLIVGTALRIPASGDKASLTFQVPQDSSLVGRKLYWQGLEVDPQRAPFYFLTNTFEETIES